MHQNLEKNTISQLSHPMPYSPKFEQAIEPHHEVNELPKLLVKYLPL